MTTQRVIPYELAAAGFVTNFPATANSYLITFRVVITFFPLLG